MKIYNILGLQFIFLNLAKCLNITHLVKKSKIRTNITYSTARDGGLFSSTTMSPWFDMGDFHAEVYEIEFSIYGFKKLKKIETIKKFISKENIYIYDSNN